MSCPNVKECSCPKENCVNHAQCCKCVSNHIGKGDLPVCLRPKAPEEKK